jgi:hypothetical protein
MSMPATIGKGWILTKLDQVSRKSDLKTVVAELDNAAYDDGAALVNFFANLEVTLDGKIYRVLDDDKQYKFRRSGLLTEKGHALRHWFGDWWADFQPIAPILRVALREAFATCFSRNLPLDTYWICAGDEFEVAVSTSATQVLLAPPTPMVAQVTLVIITPYPEDKIIEPHEVDEQIKLVKRDSNMKVVVEQLKMIRK